MTPNPTLILKEIRGTSLSRQERIEKSIEIASILLKESLKCRQLSEKKREAWLAKMMEDPNGRLFMTEMADFCYRSHNPRRVVDQLVDLIHRIGIPNFLTESDRLKLLLFRQYGLLFPKLSLNFIKKKIQQDLASVLLPQNAKPFFKKCKEKNITINLNHLGEAILGEEEAKRRLDLYLSDLADPTIEYISVKISTLYSQINLCAFEQTLDILSERLRTLYRACSPHQFVNLDMEEYRDLDLTVALFKKVLSEPEFLNKSAGIVLQAYLPESYVMLQELTKWAIARKGAPIKIRIVKGANLAMEVVESSIKGWRQAPFEMKAESDANFKRMLEYAIDPRQTHAVHIGIGSHNLFDISYALVLRSCAKAEESVTFEMLSGMALGMQQALLKLTHKLILYCPEAAEKDFQNAVAYLVRRLDENGGEQNFLRHLFHLSPGNTTWNQEESRFKYACSLIDSLPIERRRRTPCDTHHEPDTDFSLPENRIWHPTPQKVAPIPLVIGGQTIHSETKEGIDPSTCLPFYTYSIANQTHIDTALEQAELNQASLEKLPALLRAHRKELIQAMVADSGKTALEADPELSEAIDFITYYQKQWRPIGKPKGTILVAPPWNFPLAIPTSGIAASLITGNAVIFKPAPEAVLVGWKLVNLFWEVGISKRSLQFISCDDEPVGSYLIKHPKLAAVILTGATQTARYFKQIRPSLDLMAETGGKNCMIVTAMADRDLAIRSVIHSAFSHSGQKCSACSLLILEKELYEDGSFLRQLKDAATSLPVGESWNPTTFISPLIRPPSVEFNKLDEGESWLVSPKNLENNLWTPGIKLGVKKGSFTHQNEFFAPLLGVMSADNLQEAIEMANATPFGLTSGLQSLDEREQKIWKKSIIAGNLYINRNMTGAIVGRQPFGGCKASAFGPGAKVGGPHYLSQLVHIEPYEDNQKEILPQSVVPILMRYKFSKQEQKIWKKSAESYAYWKKLYCTPKDEWNLIGQENLFYLVPKEKVIVRYNGESTLDLARILTALEICQTPYVLSEEDEETFCLKMDQTPIRLLATSRRIEKRAAAVGAYLMDKPVFSSGKVELLHYLREISISFDYHRYGYVKSPQSRTTSSGYSS